MLEPLRVLILDDSPSDAELIVHELRRSGFAPDWTRVDTPAGFAAALDHVPEVILADYSLPGFDAFRALQLLRERQLEIPCLVVTGAIGDELAVECIKQGACDYLLKDRLARLGGAVRTALAQRRLGIEKRLAEEALRERSEQLRALASELTLAEQRERRRLAMVLHDEHQQLLVGAKLRLGSLERMEDPTVRDEIREVTALIEEAIEHARSLTRELSPPILQAGGLIPALDWLAHWMEEKHHLQVDVQTDETAVPSTEDITIFLFQSVRELLFNVVKHAKVPTARVETTRREDEVRIVVSDRGVGFDPASLRMEDGHASGFGLFSIHQRLELLGGRLDIVSTPGQGSRITLWAPLRPAKASTPQAPEIMERPESAATTVGPPPSPGRTGRIRVLVVDDHKVVRQGLIRLLAAEPDIEVVGEAADGKTAVELTRRFSPDVVLMDISMPVMNGIEATRLILAESPDVRVIGLSMFEEAERAQAMRGAGAVQYLTKSAASDALVAAIRACTEPRGERQGPAAPSN